MNTVTLKPSKEKSLLRRHPWVYANAIDRVDGNPGRRCNRAGARARRPLSGARRVQPAFRTIRARVWSFDEAEPIDHAFFKRRVQRAVAHRTAMVSRHRRGAADLRRGRRIAGTDRRSLHRSVEGGQRNNSFASSPQRASRHGSRRSSPR
jgi:hypothetical protein